MVTKQSQAPSKNKVAINPTPSHARLPEWPSSLSFNLILLAIFCVLLFRQVFMHPAEIFWSSDILRAHATYKFSQWNSLERWGAFPLWDPTVFAGKSVVGDPLPAILNPLGYLFWIFRSPVFFGFYLCLILTLASWGMFLFARRFGCGAAGAFLAALGFAMSGKTAGHVFAGHIELVSTVLGLPWMLYVLERLLQVRNPWNVALFGLVLALVAVQGGVQMMYYNLLFLMAYTLIRLIPVAFERPWTELRSMIGGVVAGLALFVLFAMPWWLPITRQTFLLGARTQEITYDFAIMNSASWPDLLRHLWPFHGIEIPGPFKHDVELGFFWETASYPGLAVLFLAILCVFFWTDNFRIVGLFLLAWLLMLMALGENTPVHRLAYEWLPGFSLFRAPGRLLFYSNLILALLAGYCLSRANTIQHITWIAVAAFVAAQCFLLVVVFGRPDWPGAWLPLVPFLLLTGSALCVVFQKVPVAGWQYAVLALASLEVLLVWRPHVNMARREQVLPEHPVAAFLAARHAEEEFRILDTTGTLPQEVVARYGLETITGYHPGIYAHHLELYKKIWRRDDSGLVELHLHEPSEIVCPMILDLMNVKYLVSRQPIADPGHEQVYQVSLDPFRPPVRVYARKTALPRAYFTAQATTPEEGQTVLDGLCSLDPTMEVLVEQGAVIGEASYRAVPLERRSAGDFTVEVEAEADGVLVVSESWHPDWRAEVDGHGVEVLRANHGQLALPIAKGQRHIRVHYYPWDFYLGTAVAAIAVSLVALGLLILRVRKRNSADDETPREGVVEDGQPA